jgi:hypothetical protein
MALASDFEAVFVSKLLFIRAIRAIRSFNSGFRAKTLKQTLNSGTNVELMSSINAGFAAVSFYQ